MTPSPHPRPMTRWIGCALLALATGAAPLVASAEVAAPKVIKKVAPQFPDNTAGVNAGTVKARVQIDGGGQVTDVTIVEATPKRVFDKAATTALRAWRFEPSGTNQSYVKGPTGRLRPAQMVFLERIRAAGGVAFMARDCRDVRRELKALEGRT